MVTSVTYDSDVTQQVVHSMTVMYEVAAKKNPPKKVSLLLHNIIKTVFSRESENYESLSFHSDGASFFPLFVETYFSTFFLLFWSYFLSSLLSFPLPSLGLHCDCYLFTLHKSSFLVLSMVVLIFKIHPNKNSLNS